MISDLTDPHKQVRFIGARSALDWWSLSCQCLLQTFLRGHDNQITCMSVSRSGNLIATGQRGDNADVIIWDYQTRSLKHRLNSHDHCVTQVVQALCSRGLAGS